MTLVCVSVQIGSITKTSRTNVSIEEPNFTFDEDNELFEDLQIKVERIASPALRLYKVKTTRDDTAMYLKPSLGVKQAEWVALTPGNWKHYIDIARGHHQKCRTNKGPFVVKLFVFAAKRQLLRLQEYGGRQGQESKTLPVQLMAIYWSVATSKSDLLPVLIGRPPIPDSLKVQPIRTG
ncbi:hypothetical protein PInf_028972 [Phytophthora infestans]|nr:hypothetical protein PInf_028972 [Phytophthora infestans]